MIERPRTRRIASCALVVCCVAAYLRAGEPFDRLQTWSTPGTAGWTNSFGESQPANAGGQLRMSFAEQRRPESGATTCWAAVPQGLWPTDAAFRFQARVMPPSALRLYLHARQSRRLWYVSLAAPSGTDATTFTVPFSFDDARWICDANSGRAQFEEDLHFLDWVGVYVRRHGTPSGQDYEIDDFRIRGFISPSDTDIDGIPDDWELLHGFSPDDWTDAMDDADKDGMSNYGEFRAGTDPTNGLSWFAVDLVHTNDDTGARWRELRWPSISNRTYRILRTAGLGSGLAPIGTVDATPPSNAFVDTNTAGHVSFFYRIEVQND